VGLSNNLLPPSANFSPRVELTKLAYGHNHRNKTFKNTVEEKFPELPFQKSSQVLLTYEPSLLASIHIFVFLLFSNRKKLLLECDFLPKKFCTLKSAAL
jgi:hypothetical protein